VQSFLAPAVKNGVFEVWVDKHKKAATSGTPRSKPSSRSATFAFCWPPAIRWHRTMWSKPKSN
jgi:hypothetical protein